LLKLWCCALLVIDQIPPEAMCVGLIGLHVER
jgi:hypothetical protein